MKHKIEKYSKRFKNWNQFVAMLFWQVALAKSRRELSGGLTCCMCKLRHLGIPDAPSKSMLSYANKIRLLKLFQDLFYDTFKFCWKACPGKHKFRFKNKLLSLDGTTIFLRGMLKTKRKHLLTNHYDFGSTTLSAIYKTWWQIELLFKATKHNLRIKTFFGTSRNVLYMPV